MALAGIIVKWLGQGHETHPFLFSAPVPILSNQGSVILYNPDPNPSCLGTLPGVWAVSISWVPSTCVDPFPRPSVLSPYTLPVVASSASSSESHPSVHPSGIFGRGVPCVLLPSVLSSLCLLPLLVVPQVWAGRAPPPFLLFSSYLPHPHLWGSHLPQPSIHRHKE